MSTLKTLRTEKELAIQHYEHSLAEHIEEEESRRIVQQLHSAFPRFIGELSGLVNPVSLQWSNALKIALGPRMLCSLVVFDTATALSMNKFLKSLNTVRDVVILDRAKAYSEA